MIGGNFLAYLGVDNVSISKILSSERPESSADKPKVYPNPAKDQIIISPKVDLEIESVEIVSSIGVIIDTYVQPNSSVQGFILQVGSYPAGTYILKINYNGFSHYAKFIKK